MVNSVCKTFGKDPGCFRVLVGFARIPEDPLPERCDESLTANQDHLGDFRRRSCLARRAESSAFQGAAGVSSEASKRLLMPGTSTPAV